jgi:hypothetical protein
MFNLNENFLKDLGLEAMPEERRAAFLQHVEEEMDQRIGNRLSAALNDEKFNEFVSLSNGDQAIVEATLAAAGDWRNSQEFQALVQASGTSADDPELIAEYVGMLWVSQNVPGYGQIVDDEVAKLVEEIKANREQILAA